MIRNGEPLCASLNPSILHICCHPLHCLVCLTKLISPRNVIEWWNGSLLHGYAMFQYDIVDQFAANLSLSQHKLVRYCDFINHTSCRTCLFLVICVMTIFLTPRCWHLFLKIQWWWNSGIQPVGYIITDIRDVVGPFVVKDIYPTRSSDNSRSSVSA
jgi:hypothetical protein